MNHTLDVNVLHSYWTIKWRSFSILVKWQQWSIKKWVLCNTFIFNLIERVVYFLKNCYSWNYLQVLILKMIKRQQDPVDRRTDITIKCPFSTQTTYKAMFMWIEKSCKQPKLIGFILFICFQTETYDAIQNTNIV